MDALAYAVAMAAANAAAATPPGGADLVHYTGQILSWDESTGLNSVAVNGAAVSNLRVLQSGIGLVYQPGDTVVVEKRMSQWYILGKVGAPGAGAANQIVSARVAVLESTSSTSYTDLTTYGPEVSVYIGSSRRCLIVLSAYITASATNIGNYLGGHAAVVVSGASTIAAPAAGFVSELALCPNPGNVGIGQTGTAFYLLQASDGLNVGVNIFTLKYRSNVASPSCGFNNRAITVIPF